MQLIEGVVIGGNRLGRRLGRYKNDLGRRGMLFGCKRFLNAVDLARKLVERCFKVAVLHVEHLSHK